MSSTETYVRLVKHLGGPSAAAKALGVKQGTASGWIRGDHGMSAAVALKAQFITGGLFSASELNEQLAEIEAQHEVTEKQTNQLSETAA